MQDIIEFTKSLGIELGLGQRMFLKLAYGMEFDDSILYPVEDPFKAYEPLQMTEKQLFKVLSEDNILFGEKESRFVSAVCGRRSGKSLLGALAMAYELEFFLKRNQDPCKAYGLVLGSKFYFGFFGPTHGSSCNMMSIFLTLVEQNPFLKARIGSKTLNEIVFETDEDIERKRKGTVIIEPSSFSQLEKGKNFFMVVMDEIEFGYGFKKTYQSICPSLYRYPDNLNFTFSTRANYENPMTSYCKPRFIFKGNTTLMNPRSINEKDVKYMVQNNFKNFVKEFCV